MAHNQKPRALTFLVAAAVLARRGSPEKAAQMFHRAVRDASLASAVRAVRAQPSTVLSRTEDWPLSTSRRRVLSSTAAWPFSRVNASGEMFDEEADLSDDLTSMGLMDDTDDVLSAADEFPLEVEADADEFRVEVESATDDEFRVEVESEAGDEFRVEVESATDEDEDEDEYEDDDEDDEDAPPQEEARFIRALANFQRRDAVMAAKKKAPAKKPAAKRR